MDLRYELVPMSLYSLLLRLAQLEFFRAIVGCAGSCYIQSFHAIDFNQWHNNKQHYYGEIEKRRVTTYIGQLVLYLLLLRSLFK